jgi:hypothetical protein
MSKSIRRQLADAHQELRDKENAVEEATLALELKVRNLELENLELKNRLAAIRYELHTTDRLLEATRNSISRGDMYATLATGKSERS